MVSRGFRGLLRGSGDLGSGVLGFGGPQGLRAPSALTP